jgi:hypothetical protein
VSLSYPGSNVNLYFKFSNKEGEEKEEDKFENGIMRDATFKEGEQNIFKFWRFPSSVHPFFW